MTLPFPEEQLDILAGIVDEHIKVGRLTDYQLALALLHEVWAEVVLGTREEALIFEAVNRIYPEVTDEDGPDDE